VLSDRVGRPNAFIVAGSLAGAALLGALPTMPAAAVGLLLVGMFIGAPPGPLTSLLPRALAPERLATGLGVSYTIYYLIMAAVQPAAGLLRDRTGDPATPVRFAAVAMATTVVGLAAFRLIAGRAAATSRSTRP
jgi:MFS family permease